MLGKKSHVSKSWRAYEIENVFYFKPHTYKFLLCWILLGRLLFGLAETQTTRVVLGFIWTKPGGPYSAREARLWCPHFSYLCINLPNFFLPYFLLAYQCFVNTDDFAFFIHPPFWNTSGQNMHVLGSHLDKIYVFWFGYNLVHGTVCAPKSKLTITKEGDEFSFSGNFKVEYLSWISALNQ